MEFPKDEVMPTEEGTTQGGTIRPLLVNIALDGMEKALGIKTRRTAVHVISD